MILDNVVIERLRRSLKYEAVYLHELADGFSAERVISAGMTFYSHVRPHSALWGTRWGRTGDAPRPKPTARSEQHEHPNAAAWADLGGHRPPGARGSAADSVAEAVTA